jgi:hypothetical protein
MDDGFTRQAYPSNGNKRKRGRPPGTPNPNGGRRKGDISNRTIIEGVVTKELKDMLSLRAKKLTEKVLEEECRLAFSDIRLIPGCPVGIPDEIAFAIQSFELNERVLRTLDSGEQLIDRRTKFTLWPKGNALERISRQLGLYEQDNKQKGEAQRPQINLYLEQGSVNIPQLPDSAANGYGEHDE